MQFFTNKIMKQLLVKEDGGVMIIVAASIITLMMAIGGGIDLSRYLVAKTQAQAAIDNAVLSAAAVAGENQNPTTVANEFFSANYPASTGTAGRVNVAVSADGNVFTGTVNVAVDPFFGSIVGITDYDFTVLGEVVIDNTGTGGGADVVLTIDNSRSMCLTGLSSDPSCAKLNAMKTAARRFVRKVLNDNPTGMHIGIVPFTQNVKMASEHPAFGPSVHQDGGKSVYLQTVLPLTNNRGRLLRYINAMSLNPDDGNNKSYTRTNVGTLAAGLMLMPFAQDKAHFNHNPDMPRDFDPDRLDKVIILMTDGENAANRLSLSTPSMPEISDADNAHQVELCTRFKADYQITIYAVTYDLPDGPVKDIFRNCATNEQFFFDAGDAASLADAYEVIANGLRRLRLHR